ncbi:MAG: Mth938-like domain-containing protein [Rubrimonas sp.]|uniref:Mth938-like domain-containing protein n=1 Tax=Rubrimonas sp. TaxID=2036015 RepID=UPI002FDD993D
MRMSEVRFPRGAPVTGYGPEGFEIGGVWHAGAVLLLGAVSAWRPAAPLTPACFAEALAAVDRFDLIILGTGADLAPPPPETRAALEAAGFGVEIMATPSGCRTYNVLLAEDRAVCAALLTV